MHTTNTRFETAERMLRMLANGQVISEECWSLFFSDKDDEGYQTPIMDLFEFIRQNFDHVRDEQQNRVVLGVYAQIPEMPVFARHLLNEVERRQQEVLSGYERALLLTMQAIVEQQCNRYAADANQGFEHRWNAADKFEQAANMLEREGGASTQIRHLLWRAGSQWYDVDEMDAAVDTLIRACKGNVTHTTQNLYYQIAGRYFQLPDDHKQRMRQAVRRDLALAYACLPAMTCRPERVGGRLNDAEENCPSTNRGELGVESRVFVRSLSHRLPGAVPLPELCFLNPRARWLNRAFDRLGVLAMLTDADAIDEDAGALERWGYEAVRLYEAWEDFAPLLPREDSHRFQKLRAHLQTLSEREWQVPDLLQPTPLPTYIKTLVVEGKMVQAEAKLQNLLNNASLADNPIFKAQITFGMAWCIANNRSSQEAQNLLDDGLAQIDQHLCGQADSNSFLSARALLLHQKAVISRLSGDTSNVSSHLNEALISAALAGDVVSMLSSNQQMEPWAKHKDAADEQRCQDVTTTLLWMWGTKCAGHNRVHTPNHAHYMPRE